MKRLASFLLIPILLLTVGWGSARVEGRVSGENYSQENGLGPNGALPPNFLDITPDKNSHSLWKSVVGSYEIGQHQRLRRLGPSCSVTEGQAHEGRYITIAEDGVVFEKSDQDVRATEKYFGAVFHEPYSGWCGSAGCNPGISGHSLVYKLSRPIATDRCIDALKYIIIAFNTEARRYNRVFLSSLTGKERGEGNVTFNFDLDDLDHNNFQSTHFYRQEPAVDWINTVPGKTVCTHIAFGNPDAVKEAERRNLTNRDCQQSQVSDKGRIRDLPVFPGQVSYAAIKKPIEVQVFAQDFFRLKPVQKNRESGKGRKLEGPALRDGVVTIFRKALRAMSNTPAEYYQKPVGSYRGDAIDQYNTGMMYAKGDGVPENHKEALKWFKRAADNGLANAQNALGNYYFYGGGYYEGLDLSSNQKTATLWYKRAAEQGFAEAQYNLGNIYMIAKARKRKRRHIDSSRNNALAYMWHTLAMSGGDPFAKPFRDQIENKMSSAEIEAAERMARNCALRHYKNC